jgi:hypothetical protein
VIEKKSKIIEQNQGLRGKNEGKSCAGFSIRLERQVIGFPCMYRMQLSCGTASYNKRDEAFASFCFGCEFAKNNMHGNPKVSLFSSCLSVHCVFRCLLCFHVGLSAHRFGVGYAVAHVRRGTNVFSFLLFNLSTMK